MAGHPLVSTMEVKRVGTFPVILVKLVTPPLPPTPDKVNLEHHGWKCVLFLATTLLGGVGNNGMNLKAKGNRLFHTVPSSFVPYCSPCLKVVCENPEYDDQ